MRNRYLYNYQLPRLCNLSKFRNRLLYWFERNGRKFPWRKSSASKFQLIIAEVLLQRTRAETVAVFFPRFIQEFPSWKHLDSASAACLHRYLKPLGLWRRRSSSIRKLAREMVKRNSRFPRDPSQIKDLPGIGQYIANSIMLFCHNISMPLLDVNMARVLERVFGPRKLSDIRHDPYLQQLAGRIVKCKTPIKLNWAILDLAATICLIRKPRCYDCPLELICMYADLAQNN